MAVRPVALEEVWVHRALMAPRSILAAQTILVLVVALAVAVVVAPIMDEVLAPVAVPVAAVAVFCRAQAGLEALVHMEHMVAQEALPEVEVEQVAPLLAYSLVLVAVVAGARQAEQAL